MEKLLREIDDLFEEEAESGVPDDVIFFRFTSMQELCLFDLDEDEYEFEDWVDLD